MLVPGGGRFWCGPGGGLAGCWVEGLALAGGVEEFGAVAVGQGLGEEGLGLVVACDPPADLERAAAGSAAAGRP
jgi:hypothetical protein